MEDHQDFETLVDRARRDQAEQEVQRRKEETGNALARDARELAARRALAERRSSATKLEELGREVAQRLDPRARQMVGRTLTGTPGEPSPPAVGLIPRTSAWPEPVAKGVFLARNGRLFYGWFDTR
jgi:hypothetical protein